MPYDEITYEVENQIARLTLNKPKKLNALSWSTWAEIERAILETDESDDAKVLIITGAGRGFSSGTDLTRDLPPEKWQPRPYSDREGRKRSRYLATELVYHCRKPTIAAVNGACVGAGFSLALACDIRIASEAARFSAMFVKRAIVADTGTTWFLPRLIGMENALKMMYTGRLVPADEALQMGIISEVVPADQLDARATALASEIASGPSLAVELIKQLAQDGLDNSLGVQIQYEEYLQRVTHNSEDVSEGRLAFLEKRDPVFRGR